MSATSEPLIGLDTVKASNWADIGHRVAESTFRRAVLRLPRTMQVVLHLAWQTSPRLTIAAAIAHVLSGCVTTFGLLATADVFTNLLTAGPTSERVIAAIPSILVVVASYMARAGLDGAVAAIEASLRPRVRMAADDAVTAAVIHTELLAFEDADFRDLARQDARRGIDSIETGLSETATFLASLVSVLAALVTAAILNPWLAPVLLLAAGADGLAAAKVGKMRY